MIALGGLGLGLILTGDRGDGLTLGLLLYLAWHLFHLWRLGLCLTRKQAVPVWQPPGLWRILFQEVSRLDSRSRKRKAWLGRYYLRFREAAGVVPDGLVILDQRGRVEWANPAADALLGIRVPRDLGRRLRELVGTDTLGPLLGAAERKEGLGLVSPVDKSKVLSVSVRPFGRKKHQQLLLIRDITRVHLVDQARADFVANVSHELRTPLTVVNGFLEYLEDQELPDAEMRRAVAMMQEQAGRMESIVSDLLALSRLEMDDLAPAEEPAVAVPALLDSIVAEARALSGGAGHVFSCQADQSLGLLGRESELRSAFSNLVFNAVRHTPSQTRIHLSWARQGSSGVFSVLDSGPGIAPEHLPRLTERFYRVDKARSRRSGGTGLGLAIVKHIMRRHRGNLDISSTLGQGTTVTVSFPQAR